MFKVFINNYYEHIHVRYISHDCNFEDINQLILAISLIFYIVVKRFMITKNSIVEVQNLVVNHESRVVKSNPEI